MTIDWSDYPNFKYDELKCKHTGECNMHPDMMHILQSIRDELEKPIFISSGFRSSRHPLEQEKNKPGEHVYGMAVDIICHGAMAFEIIRLALGRNVKRIGVHQKGRHGCRFVHLGIANRFSLEFPESIWTY